MDVTETSSNQLSLLDLVESSRWQRLQDHFANVLGVTIRTMSPSRELLVSPSWPAGFSTEHAIELLKVGEEVEQLVPADGPSSDTSSLTTSLGVTYAAVPIFAVPPRVIAFFIVGPMVVGPREEKTRFRQRVDAMGVDAHAAWNLILSLKPYTYSGIHSLLNLLQEVGTSLVQFAYQANRLATILPSTDLVDPFREDLYYRIHVIAMRLPSLRERVGDIPLLVEHFIARSSQATGKTISGVTEDAMRALVAYRWPGNVRELENVIERAVVLAKHAKLDAADLPDETRGRSEATTTAVDDQEDDAKVAEAAASDEGAALKDALKMPERDIILKVLAEVRWNRSEAAKRLGIHRSTLYHKIRQLGIDKSSRD